MRKRYIFHPLDTSYTHSHELKFHLHVFQELDNEHNKDQALALFQRNLELPLGGNCIILKKAHDHTFTETTNEGISASIGLMYEYIRELVHNSSPHTSISATPCGDENWVKGYFMLVPQEETFTFQVDGLLVIHVV